MAAPSATPPPTMVHVRIKYPTQNTPFETETTTDYMWSSTANFCDQFLDAIREQCYANTNFNKTFLITPINATISLGCLPPDKTVQERVLDQGWNGEVFGVRIDGLATLDMVSKGTDELWTLIPQWPQGFPFTVKTPWDGSFKLLRDDWGKIQSKPSDRKIGVSRVRDKVETGWVAWANIEAGNRFLYDKVEVVVKNTGLSQPATST